jgi:cobalt-zinc-cadmium efflux system outer membrane protein
MGRLTENLKALVVMFCSLLVLQAQEAQKSSEFISKDGLTIENLIEMSKSKRADLQASKQRLAIAQGKVRQVSLFPNPTFEFQHSSTQFLSGETETGIKLSQNFQLGGKRQKQKMIAELELQQTQSEILALERQIEIEVIKAYVNGVVLAQQLEVLERLIKVDREIIGITEARLKEGDVAPLDLNLIKVEAERLKIQALQTRAELENQILELKLKVGIPLNEQLRLAPQDNKPMLIDLTLDELIEIALKERPELRFAKLTKQIAETKLSLARKNAIPDVIASVGISQKKQIFDFPVGNLFIKRERSLNFAVSLDLPIFNRNQGEIASATAENIQANKTIEFLENTIKRDVAVAYKKYRASLETLLIYLTQILPNLEANFKSVSAAYGFGGFSMLDLINEQRRLIENTSSYHQALRDYYISAAELENAVGKKLPKISVRSMEETTKQVNLEELLKSIQKFSKEERK